MNAEEKGKLCMFRFSAKSHAGNFLAISQDAFQVWRNLKHTF